MITILAPRRSDRTENTHHRRGIGGRYDSADQQAGRERQRAGPDERVAHRKRCHHNRHHRQHQYRHPIIDRSRFMPSVAWNNSVGKNT